MPLDTLIFDAYGTLFDVHSIVAKCDERWPGKGTQLSQVWRAKQLEYSWQRTIMGRYIPFSAVTRDALEYACESLGLALSAEQRDTLLDAYRYLQPYPDVPDALVQLRAGGRKLAILTNGSPDMIDPLVRNCAMDRTFDAVLSVDSLHTFKPSMSVYQMATEKLGAQVARTGFVSSNCWDALAARTFGFRVWWINRANAPVDRLGAVPDGILKGLGELPTRLG